MKGLILFESFYGNTKEVAQVIAAQLIAGGHQVTLVDLRETPKPSLEVDFLLVGSPTRFGKPTRRARKIVKKLDRAHWQNRPIGVFDTHIPIKPEDSEKTRKWIEPGAAGWLKQMLENAGLKISKEPLRCKVKDMKGPLLDGELDRAKRYAQEFMAVLR
ncbi:MAG: flavodoxin domain-containing protein [Thermoplasmata archaeon]